MAQESYSSKYCHWGRGGSDPSYGRLCCSNRAFGLDCLDTLCDHLHVDTSPFLGAGNCAHEGLSKRGRSHVTCCARGVGNAPTNICLHNRVRSEERRVGKEINDKGMVKQWESNIINFINDYIDILKERY